MIKIFGYTYDIDGETIFVGAWALFVVWLMYSAFKWIAQHVIPAVSDFNFNFNVTVDDNAYIYIMIIIFASLIINAKSKGE